MRRSHFATRRSYRANRNPPSQYTWTTPAASRTYTRNGLNQYTTISGTGLSYDLRGNLTSDGARTFGYDYENRLASVSGSGSMTLAYDPGGRLRQTVAGGATTQFLYGGNALLAEYDGAGTLLRRYVHGPGIDEPLVWYEGAGLTDRRYLIADRQGSIVAVNGATSSRQLYGPYGEPDTWAGSRFRYTGQIALPEVSLYHYKARAYDPVLGRFLQTDPVGYADGLNWYAYVGNDPLNASDPGGQYLLAIRIGRTAAAISGATRTATPLSARMDTGYATLPMAPCACIVLPGPLFDLSGSTSNSDAGSVGKNGNWTTEGGNVVRNHGGRGDGREYAEGKGHTGQTVDDIFGSTVDSYPGSHDNATGKEKVGTTVVVGENGDWAQVNDKTGEIIQLNDKNNPRQQPPRRKEPEE